MTVSVSARPIVVIDRVIRPTTTEGSPQSVLEPLDVQTVKDVLRFTSSAEDHLIRGWIQAAREHIEEQTGRQIMTATREMMLDGAPTVNQIQVCRPPLQTVDAIVLVDESDAETAFASYTVIASAYDAGSPTNRFIDTHCPPGVVRLLSSGSWPTVTAPATLRIRYTAGYADTQDEVPEIIKAAMYLIIGHLHRTRSEVGPEQFETPLGARAIIRALRDSALLTQNLRTA